MAQVQTNTTNNSTPRDQENQGSGAPNLQQILQQNAGYASAIGNNIANQLGQQANQFNTQTNTSAQNFNNALNQSKQNTENTLNQASGVLGGSGDNSNLYKTNNVTGVNDYTGLQNQTDPNYYTNLGTAIQNSGYTGPGTFSTSGQGQQIINKAGNLADQARNVNNAQGQQSLLNQYVGKGNYTPGQSGLDRALLSQNQGARQQITQAGNQLGQAASNAQNIVGAADQNQANVKGTLDTEKGNLSTNLGNIYNSLYGGAQTAGTNFNTDINDLKSGFANYKTGDQLTNTTGTELDTLNKVLGPDRLNSLIYNNSMNSNNPAALQQLVQSIGGNLNNNGQNGSLLYQSPEQQAAVQNLYNLTSNVKGSFDPNTLQSLNSQAINPNNTFNDTSKAYQTATGNLNDMYTQDKGFMDAYGNVKADLQDPTLNLYGKNWSGNSGVNASQLRYQNDLNQLNNGSNSNLYNQYGVGSVNSSLTNLGAQNNGGILQRQSDLRGLVGNLNNVQDTFNNPATHENLQSYLQSLFNNGGSSTPS